IVTGSRHIGRRLDNRGILSCSSTGIEKNPRTRGESGSMRRSNRSFLFSLLVPACFAISAGAQAQGPAQAHEHVGAQGQGRSAVKGGLWSDPSTWSGGEVPEEGDIVTIAAGVDVVLDVSPPALNGMHVDGRLSFANDEDLEL